jgi:hypothetical protein
MLVIAATHSLAVTALMVLAVVLLGIVVGIVPVVIFRLVAGGPRRPRPRRHPKPRMFEPAPVVAPAPVSAPAVESRVVEPEPEPVVEVRVEAVSERHRDLYDEEYARQVDRVETLRRTIRTRLAVGAQTNDV